MTIVISNQSRDPIYTQIEKQIKGAIIGGEIKEGDALPSMRALAKDLKVSMITTKRAYEELERGGFILTVAGKGSYVAPKNLEFVREAHLKEIEECLLKAISLSDACNIEISELHEILDTLCKGE